ncbi:MAG: L-threonine 3-dehydrogenase [Gammaproteobacteria bacterium RIFCSPHIGHO2_12_FULL_45_9]|nr:MAG: L-threonine 3-dehydrogenase [Gammaproteobacteria bacterium RIFCSPHIGHO2_12_FULL_45_9]
MKVLSKLKAEPGLWLSEAPIPTPGPQDVLIKIKQTAICGTDLHIYKWDTWAQKTIPVPMHVGHEFVGEVCAVGSEVHDLQPGMRVSGEGHITCGTCRNCRAGKRHLCRFTIGVGVTRPGAFAEYLVLPTMNVYRIPDDITDDQAAVLDPFGNAVHTTLEFDLIGEDVLITGAGPIGLMACAIAKHVGARHVVVSDVNPVRLALAEQMGASYAVNPTTTSFADVMKQLGMKEGFDIGLEMSGNAAAFQGMLEYMNYGGRIAFLGLPSEAFPIDWSNIIFKSLQIHGIYGRKIFETWYKGIAMLQSGLNINPIITAHYPVNDYQKAFQALLDGQAAKVILTWT